MPKTHTYVKLKILYWIKSLKVSAVKCISHIKGHFLARNVYMRGISCIYQMFIILANYHIVYSAVSDYQNKSLSKSLMNKLTLLHDIVDYKNNSYLKTLI